MFVQLIVSLPENDNAGLPSAAQLAGLAAEGAAVVATTGRQRQVTARSARAVLCCVAWNLTHGK
jgi:hypothetical protein